MVSGSHSGIAQRVSLWRCVVGCVVTDVSENLGALIFKCSHSVETGRIFFGWLVPGFSKGWSSAGVMIYWRIFPHWQITLEDGGITNFRNVGNPSPSDTAWRTKRPESRYFILVVCVILICCFLSMPLCCWLRKKRRYRAWGIDWMKLEDAVEWKRMWEKLRSWESEGSPQCRLWQIKNNWEMWNISTIWVAW